MLVQLRFTPTAALLEKYQSTVSTFFDAGSIVIPIKVRVPQQVLPVEFELKAHLSSAEVWYFEEGCMVL